MLRSSCCVNTFHQAQWDETCGSGNLVERVGFAARIMVLTDGVRGLLLEIVSSTNACPTFVGEASLFRTQARKPDRTGRCREMTCANEHGRNCHQCFQWIKESPVVVCSVLNKRYRPGVVVKHCACFRVITFRVGELCRSNVLA